jgi:N-formylglutamate amidohydrolase
MILHIPHASPLIPREMRDQIVLADDELAVELGHMTDAFTDELFASADAATIRPPLSRLLVDVERFSDDAMEPMSIVGMGMIYTMTSDGKPLRRPMQSGEKNLLKSRYYDAHHRALLNAVEKELGAAGKAMIIDCHSFPDQPLHCDRDQSMPRPDFCIGTNSFHTPHELTRMVTRYLEGEGFLVGIDRPFEGTMVPIASYQTDVRVTSIMIEVNRKLYMNESTGMKSNGFDRTRQRLQDLLKIIAKFQQRN